METHGKIPLFNQMGSSYDIDRLVSSSLLHELCGDLRQSLLQGRAVETGRSESLPRDFERSGEQRFSAPITFLISSSAAEISASSSLCMRLSSMKDMIMEYIPDEIKIGDSSRAILRRAVPLVYHSLSLTQSLPRSVRAWNTQNCRLLCFPVVFNAFQRIKIH